MKDENAAADLFRHIANLRVSEALLFEPSALLGLGEEGELLRLNLNFLKMKIRKRLTWDGRKSVVCP